MLTPNGLGTVCNTVACGFNSHRHLFRRMISGTSLFLLVMTLLSVALQIANHWFLSKGRLEISYPLTILVYICCTVLETFLALRDPTQWSIILFVPMYLWAIIMAVKGMLRLREDKYAELQRQLKRGLDATKNDTDSNLEG